MTQVRCVRCDRTEDQHPVTYMRLDGESSYCVHFDPPAPAWMQLLNKALARR